MKKLHLLEFNNKPILEQLALEEALLRADSRSFCLINYGSPPAIVMGISGEPKKLLDIAKVQRDQIPVIKRFSGGGTVVVDHATLFITFLFSKEDLALVPFPEPILRWTADLYKESWQIPSFALRENDYAIGEKKCGGNAQYIQKDRWLHHTSFLWDYSEQAMSYLQLPEKRPKYRLDRSHADFLCRLKDHSSDPKMLISKLKSALVKRFYIEPVDPSELILKPHRKSTTLYQF